MMDLFLTVLLDEDEAPPVPTSLACGEIWVSPSEQMQVLLGRYFAQMP